jgi:PAS domain S-box-containing protein
MRKFHPGGKKEELRREIEDLHSRLKVAEEQINSLKNLSDNVVRLRETEKVLLESEERYRSLFNNMLHGFAHCRMIYKDGKPWDFVYLNVNDAFGKLTGLKNITGKRVTEVIPGIRESSPDLFEVYGRVALTGKPERLETYLSSLNTWFNISVYSPEREYFVAIFDNITENKHAVELLKASEEKLKYHFENSPLAVVEWDSNYKVKEWSKEAERMFGWKPEETIGKPINSLNLIHQDDLPVVAGTMERLSSGNEAKIISENRNITKSGQIINCIWYNTVLLDSNSQMASVMSLVEDITTRKITETKLKDAMEKLDIALENANIGLWDWDLKSGEFMWDERMEKMFGLIPGIFGNTYQDFENCVHEEDLPHLNHAIEKALKIDIPFETVFRTKPVNEKSKYISLKALLKKDSSGSPASLSGVCFDVTGMKSGTEQALIKLNEELLRSNRDLQQFAYVASHDLQEPLRMVSSFTQMLEQRYKDKLDDDGKQFIKFAVDGSKRMYDLLNGLLAYSRVQTKGKEFSKVKMNEVLVKVTRNLSLKITEREAVVDIKRLPVIFADESQMIQLVQNLIENSIKFSIGPPHITFSAKSDTDFHIFSMKDNGIGIEAQYFERIFKIFQRLHHSDDYEGTGVGLAICKRIIERHGGSIWVESQPDKGSSFFFTIPKNVKNDKKNILRYPSV